MHVTLKRYLSLAAITACLMMSLSVMNARANGQFGSGSMVPGNGQFGTGNVIDTGTCADSSGQMGSGGRCDSTASDGLGYLGGGGFIATMGDFLISVFG